MSDQDYMQDNASSGILSVPYNRDAEEALIGSILINPEAFLEVAAFLDPDDFYIIRNKWIWEAFRHLTQAETPFDLITVSKELEDNGHLEDIGGRAYLMGLANQVPSSLHAESYGHIIQENAIRRRMLAAANDIAKLAYRQDQSIATVIDEAEKAIFSVSEKRIRHDLVPIKDVLGKYLERVETMAQRSDEVYGLLTGLDDLDAVLGGLQNSDFLIVAGRPGMGKTGFLIGVMKHVAMNLKKNVAMFSLEMSNEQLVQRLLAQETGIDSQRLRTGKLKDNEWGVLLSATSSLEEATIYIDDTPAITPLQLRTKCRRLDMEIGLDLVIVDYLQLMSGDFRTDNRVQEVSNISRNLKVLARELNVPVLAAAQLSRAVEQRTDKQPVLSDLRESGSLEQDADIVMFINRPDAMDEASARHNLAQLIVAKHRNGPTHGGIDLIFIKNLAQFKSADQASINAIKKGGKKQDDR
jgi:replicative DNA helicase